MSDIQKLVDELKVSIAEEKRLRAEGDNVKLDKRIAERSGDSDAMEAAKKLESTNLTEWAKHYTATKDGFRLIVVALGLDPADLRSALS